MISMVTENAAFYLLTELLRLQCLLDFDAEAAVYFGSHPLPDRMHNYISQRYRRCLLCPGGFHSRQVTRSSVCHFLLASSS